MLFDGKINESQVHCVLINRPDKCNSNCRKGIFELPLSYPCLTCKRRIKALVAKAHFIGCLRVFAERDGYPLTKNNLLWDTATGKQTY